MAIPVPRFFASLVRFTTDGSLAAFFSRPPRTLGFRIWNPDERTGSLAARASLARAVPFAPSPVVFINARQARPLGGLGKRIADVAIATAVLVVALPLLLLAALAVKLTMGGPVLYRHRRIGFSGRPFDCLKFRTMVVNGDEVLAYHLARNPAAAEEWRRDRKLARDPRVTPLGALLRKSSLDELPQLLNVLKGEMSCVGPRPVVADELQRYGTHAEAYLRARPGMTGSWQVSGRSSVDYDDRVALDSAYVSKWSFGSDILILFRTVPALLKVDQAA